MTKTTLNSAEHRLPPDRQAAGRLVLRRHAASLQRRLAAVTRSETVSRVRATHGTEDVWDYIRRYEAAAYLRPTPLTFFCEDGSIVEREG